MKENRMEPIPYTGDKGYKLGDVLDKKVTMEEFVAQLSDDDLICMFRGEGMCSPKVTPGTAAAFGGLTPNFRSLAFRHPAVPTVLPDFVLTAEQKPSPCQTVRCLAVRSIFRW